MGGATDVRLRIAVDAGLDWYVGMCAAHRVPSRIADGVWRALGPMPPLHSAALVIEPDVSVDHVDAALAEAPHRGVADCFGTLDLSGLGMEPLFEGTWLHLATPATSAPTGWSRVTTASALERWNSAGDTTGVLVPALLDRPTFAVLRAEPARSPLGCVATLGTGAVHLSNVRGDAWDEVVAAVAATFPGRPVVTYERDASLDAAVAVGFERVGTTRIWVAV